MSRHVKQWTPIQHGRFILRNMLETETVEQFARRMKPEITPAELRIWKRNYQTAVSEDSSVSSVPSVANRK